MPRLLEIEVVDGDTGQTRIQRYPNAPVTIGRNPRNMLCLDANFVSGWHAKVEFDEAGGWFVDVGSTNGSTVAGRRVAPGERVAIADRLEVRLGKIELRLSWAWADAAGVPTRSRPEPTAPLARAPSGSTATIQPVREPTPAPTEPEPERAEPPQGRPCGAEVTGFVDLAGIHAAIHELRPLYAELEAARGRFGDRLEAALASLPESTRAAALAWLRREFAGAFVPAPRSEPPPPQTGATPERSPGPDRPAHAATGDLESLAAGLLRDVDAPTHADERAAFVARLVEVLHTSAQAFVELRAVQSRFGDEMGVRSIREYTPLHSAADAGAVLDYLLDWRRGGPDRTAQLATAYGDFMLHQVALINGVVDGVEALLDQLRPEEIERGVGGLGKGAAAWKRYQDRYAEIVEERGIAALVFGPEFARAYARIG